MKISTGDSRERDLAVKALKKISKLLTPKVAASGVIILNSMIANEVAINALKKLGE